MNNEQIVILKTSLRNYFAGKGYQIAIKALNEVCKYPGLRKDGVTPIFVHMLSTAYYLKSFDHLFHKTADVYFAVALLHDSVEDGFTSGNDISKSYGENISRYVAILDKSGRVESSYYKALAEDPVASVIKGSDRIHNCQTMVGVFSIEKQRKYIEETRSKVIPMLEQAADNFSWLDPIYENIKLVLSSQLQLIEQMHEAIFVK